MPNNYFRFKEFTVNQERCAMKVCTDACLFGAWVAENASGVTRVLDIGTGTGLLSLMLAQKSEAVIDAVEIDEEAYGQATENFAGSPWSDRLQVFHQRIQDYGAGPYDLIISNPPFYEGDLKSNDDKRNLALHSEALGLEGLLQAVKRLLTDDGKFAVLLPFHRGEYFENLVAKYGFSVEKKVFVQQTPSHPSFRIMYLVSGLTAVPDVLSITIKSNNQYTESFSHLLKDYYLR